jgi:hypothetical protein
MHSKRFSIRALLGAAVAVAGIGSALASSVPLSDTTLSTGTTSFGSGTTLAVPGSYTYANTFAGGVGLSTIAGATSGFFDDYVFTITGASANSVTSTINLGDTLAIDGLQVALFDYTLGQAVPVSGPALITGWSTAINSGGVAATISVIPQTTLAPGTYALEVQGTVTGTAGGSYSGTLNLAPVPLPATLTLMISGVAGLGLWGRRRQAPAAAV